MKDALIKLHDAMKDAEECLSLLQTAFIYYSPPHLTECRGKLEGFVEAVRAIEKRIDDASGEDSGLRHLVPVPGHILVIGDNIKRLCRHLERKISEEVLFSFKAIEEMNFLFQRLVDILSAAAELVLARNEIIANYIKESEDDVAKKTTEYATFHEERLIDGVCQPIAAPIYLGMLDSIKKIARHAKQIAGELS